MPGSSAPAATAASRRDVLHSQLIRSYSYMFSDRLFQEWFEHSGFANFGYWSDSDTRAATASEQLVDRLVERIPAAARRGAVLDAGCGAGGTTKRLSRHFAVDQITAINIGLDQLESASKRVPEARFLRMDAAQLDFPDESFDHVVCVEAAHHFHTRARFLVEAFRVLKPGGYLVMADVLFTLGDRVVPHVRHALLRRVCEREPLTYAPENVIQNVEAYAELLWLTGFRDVEIDNAVDRTWRQFYRNYRRFLWRALMKYPLAMKTILNRLVLLATWNCSIKAYPLVCARKPLPAA
jgi:MPBQ/MSBQ methyltransferase